MLNLIKILINSKIHSKPMKRIKGFLALIIAITVLPLAAVAMEVNEGIKQMAQELESQSPSRVKIKVAVLQFRTSDNRITRFNQYIQDGLFAAYKGSARFEIIDMNSINRIVEASNWDLEKSLSFKSYTELSELIFKETGIVPDAFIYGQINDNDEYITLSGYLVPNGIKSTNIQSVVRFNSSEQTDKLLGKPVRKREKPKPDTVVVYKEKIVEKPVYVEKEVVKEVPVYIEKAKEEPVTPAGEFTAKIGDLEIEITKVQFNGDRIEITVMLTNNKEEQKIANVWPRFFDAEGNEFKEGHNTIAYSELIAGVPAKRAIYFTGKVSNVSLIRVLEIELGAGQGKAQFRNIPVKR